MIGWHLPIHARHLPYKVDGLPVLFAASVLRRVSMTLLALFSPIYIFGIAREGGLVLSLALASVFAFFFLIYLAKILTIPLAENLGFRYGFKGVLLLSGPPFLLFIPLLVWMKQLPFLIIPAAVLLGMHNGFFWWGYHGFFVKAGKAISFGEELGAANIFETFAMVSTPVGGAFLVQNLGFGSLFWLAGLTLIFSLTLLVPASQRIPKTDVRLGEVIKLISRHKGVALGYFGNGAEAAVYNAVWPLFLFLTLGTALKMGAVVSLAVLVAAVMTFLVGLWVDRRGEREMIAVGTPLLSFSWIMRSLGTTPALFVAADSLWRFAEGMVSLPMNVLSYKKALEGTGRALMFRELALASGPVFLTLILVVWALLGLPLVWSFLLAAGASLLPILSVRFDNKA